MRVSEGVPEGRIKTLLNHFNIEDPKITNLKQMFKRSLEDHTKINRDITSENFLKSMEEIYVGATKEQLKFWHDEFIRENKR